MEIKNGTLYMMRCYEVLCADCGEAETFAQYNATRKLATEWFEKEGWRKLKHGWVCRYCQTIDEELEKNPAVTKSDNKS